MDEKRLAVISDVHDDALLVLEGLENVEGASLRIDDKPGRAGPAELVSDESFPSKSAPVSIERERPDSRAATGSGPRPAENDVV